MTKSKEELKFEQLGITDGVVFEIKELTGYYMLDLKEKVVYECSINGKKIMPVNGLYQSLLNGAWHKKRF